VGDGVAGASADGAGRVLVVVAACDGQEELGPNDLDGRGDLRAAELVQLLALLLGQLAEWVLLAAWHGGLRGVRGRHGSPNPSVMATSKPSDPLVLKQA
jgi:hypothetical protein